MFIDISRLSFLSLSDRELPKRPNLFHIADKYYPLHVRMARREQRLLAYYDKLVLFKTLDLLGQSLKATQQEIIDTFFSK